MAVLSTEKWQGEPLKININFNDSTTYTVYSDKDYSPNSQNFIKSAKFHLSEGNNKVNPLGVATSNSLNLQIYDEDNYLNPSNTDSPYYGMMINGIEIKAYISYDGSTWDDYGTFYVTNWSGSFSEGWHGMVSISAEDRMNSIGNLDMPYIPAFNEITVSDLVTYVFDKIGIDSNEFQIDSLVNRTLGYAVIKGNKVRDFLNNICQLCLARVVIDRHNIIRFVLATNLYTGHNTLTIGSEYTGSFSNKISNTIDYTKVKVVYLSSNGLKYDHIADLGDVNLVVGENTLSGITFNKTAMAISQVDVMFDDTESNAVITSVSYEAYQNGITLTINVSGEAISGANIRIYGTILETIDRYIEMNVHPNTIGGSVVGLGGRTFDFDTKQLMTSVRASAICLALKSYVNTIGNTFMISGSALTPQLYTGDELIIDNTDTMYDGNYKIIGLEIEFGENYQLDCTLLKLSGGQ